MIEYEITTQAENGEIIIFNKKAKNEKQIKDYLKNEVEKYSFVISCVEKPSKEIIKGQTTLGIIDGLKSKNSGKTIYVRY